jgi:Na+-driven multidrug efflux pump
MDAMKAGAQATLQAQAYTDAQISALVQRMASLEYRQQQDARRAMRLKISVHVAVCSVGIVLAYVVDPILLPVITGVPAIVIELADRILKII